MSPSNTTERRGWIPGFDGLRGIAVLLVFGYHVSELSRTTWPWPLSIVGEYGWMGVDLFFVLSGFLITGILRRTRNRQGYWRAFVVRRALRILPLYVVFVAFAFVVGGIATPAWTFAVFLQNWWLPFGAGHFVVVTWSLAIEEQFYVVWPAVVRTLSRRGLEGLLVAVIGLAAVLRGIVFETWGPTTASMWTVCRMDAIAMGALAALAWERAPDATGTLARRLVVPTGLVALVASAVGPVDSPIAVSLGYSLLALLFTFGLLAVRSGWPAPLVAWLDGPVPSQVGRWSYGLYLLHAPVLMWTWGVVQRVRPGGGVVSVLLLGTLGLWVSVAAAWASWHLVEQGPLSLKDRFGRLGPVRTPP